MARSNESWGQVEPLSEEAAAFYDIAGSDTNLQAMAEQYGSDPEFPGMVSEYIQGNDALRTAHDAMVQKDDDTVA